MATEQPHFASSKKNRKKIGFSLSIIFCEQGAKWLMLVCICSIDIGKLADLIFKMIEKLMLEHFFCCVRIADLSNSVFLFPWKPWTLHYKRLFCICFRQVSIEQIRGPGWLNELGRWIYKPITNTAWVRPQLCKLQKGCTRLAAASDKVYQLLAHGRWFSPASSTTKTGRHDNSWNMKRTAKFFLTWGLNQRYCQGR
jgi:hypothetical protein